jgi:tannase/feruloyl esterase
MICNGDRGEVIVARGGAFVAVALAAGFAIDAGAQTSCESLGSLALAGASVTSAATVASGAFAPPAGLPQFLVGDASTYKGLPSFCRVQLTARPSSDSDIRVEVWLPATGWNGRLLSVGNGGFGGSIGYRSLAKLLAHGFAAAATDTGHQASFIEAGWALGHPEKVADFGHRAVHEMTRAAKAAILAFYGKAAHHSYFSSCSNGGRQALMEAQRYPEDYDGILAGAPANAWTRLLTSAVYDAQVTTGDAASYIPSSKLPAIAHAVEAACDAQDGVRDGILGDPRQCRFDPGSLLCKDADAPSCLTSAQAKALAGLYEGARDAQGRRIFPGFVPGAEEGDGGWGAWITGTKPGESLLFGFGYGYFANMVYEKADWSYKTARLDDALAAAVQKTGRSVDAVDPDLARFHERGGKLVLYHGWNDPAISALNSIDYHDSVVAALGADRAASFLRLYMIPGVQHCGDGPGTTSYDSLESDPRHSLGLALQSWVEGGAAPAALVATRFEGEGSAATGAKVLMTRPLCPYPQAARYRGAGDSNDAASFECVAP